MSRKDHSARAERPSSLERFSTGRQMFINLGTADGFDKGKMLGYICGISGLSGELIGRMLIKDVYSFVDIEPDHFEQVINAFNNASYKGRSVRVDEAAGGGKGSKGLTTPQQLQRRWWTERWLLWWRWWLSKGGGGGYKGGGGGGRQRRATAAADARAVATGPSGGYRGNSERSGYPKKEGFYEPKPKFPKRERRVNETRTPASEAFLEWRWTIVLRC
ncbi:MAG: DbpA RNA binding domain-containing protein [Flavobacteriales bacterium]|nr:DbpA RNA binding domain-containing protein [Flavobacteriales bacterium]